MPTGMRPSTPAMSSNTGTVRFAGGTSATAQGGGASRRAHALPPPTNKAKTSSAPAPTKAATAHAHALIATLHKELQPDFLKSSDDLITAFAIMKRKEEALQKLKNDDESIPGSCQIGLVLLPHGRTSKSQEFKALDAKTSDVITECKKRLRDQVVKCVSLNLVHLKNDVVKSLAGTLPILAVGFSAEADIDAEKYSKHQAVADMLYCYGEDVIAALNLGTTPKTFTEMYSESTKSSLPPHPESLFPWNRIRQRLPHPRI